MELLLKAVKYNKCQWSLYGDLKVIGFLMGMQADFIKYCCSLSISGTVGPYPSTTNRRTGGIEALLHRVNIVFKKILWWT